MQRCLVPTGLYIALPEGFEAQVRPRSGLAIKKGITVLNSPGTVSYTHLVADNTVNRFPIYARAPRRSCR